MARTPAPPTPPRRLRPIEEAADYLGVHSRTIRRWITEGQLSAFRLGGKTLRIDMVEVEAFAVPVEPHQVSA